MAQSKSTKGSTKRSAAASKAGKASGRKRTAAKTAKTTARAATKPAKAAGVEAKTVAEFRDALRKNLIKPTGMVLLTRDRIEEALTGSGKLSPKDAKGIASELLKRGQKETNDVLKDLESLLGKGRGEVLAQADRARRAAGVGQNFPISSYDSLNVAQVKSRLAKLTPAELRKVRDREKRGAARKGILDAIESKLKR